MLMRNKCLNRVYCSDNMSFLFMFNCLFNVDIYNYIFIDC